MNKCSPDVARRPLLPVRGDFLILFIADNRIRGACADVDLLQKVLGGSTEIMGARPAWFAFTSATVQYKHHCTHYSANL